jgi:hypothetical protein
MYMHMKTMLIACKRFSTSRSFIFERHTTSYNNIMHIYIYIYGHQDFHFYIYTYVILTIGLRLINSIVFLKYIYIYILLLPAYSLVVQRILSGLELVGMAH